MEQITLSIMMNIFHFWSRRIINYLFNIPILFHVFNKIINKSK